METGATPVLRSISPSAWCFYCIVPAKRFAAVTGIWLMLALGSVASADTLLDISSSLSASDPTQLGRLSRNGVPSMWTIPEPFPGVFNPTLSFHYHAYDVFDGFPTSPRNHSEVTSRFVQITLNSATTSLFVSAYADAYTPDPVPVNRGLDTNWLGDLGTSGNYFGTAPAYFQVFVPEGHNLIVVVSEAGSPGAGLNLPFHVLIEGFTDTQYTDTRPTIVRTAVSSTNLLISATNGIAGRSYALLTSTNAALSVSQWLPIATNVPTADGSFGFKMPPPNPVNPLDPQRFFILQSPTPTE
jgi:hypothetical protein